MPRTTPRPALFYLHCSLGPSQPWPSVHVPGNVFLLCNGNRNRNHYEFAPFQHWQFRYFLLEWLTLIFLFIYYLRAEGRTECLYYPVFSFNILFNFTFRQLKCLNKNKHKHRTLKKAIKVNISKPIWDWESSKLIYC